MSVFNPLLVFAVSIAFFVVLMYRRVGLGISLILEAVMMSLLSLGISGTGIVLFETCVDSTTMTLVFSQLLCYVPELTLQ